MTKKYIKHFIVTRLQYTDFSPEARLQVYNDCINHLRKKFGNTSNLQDMIIYAKSLSKSLQRSGLKVKKAKSIEELKSHIEWDKIDPKTFKQLSADGVIRLGVKTRQIDAPIRNSSVVEDIVFKVNHPKYESLSTGEIKAMEKLKEEMTSLTDIGNALLSSYIIKHKPELLDEIAKHYILK